MLPQTEEPPKEIEVENRGLVLLVTRSQRKTPTEINSATLGVFEELSEGNRFMHIYLRDQYYILYPSEDFGGLRVPLITSGKNSHSIFKFRAIKRGLEIYSGQEEIVRTLRCLKDFEAHADWIEKLKKPYLIHENYWKKK